MTARILTRSPDWLPQALKFLVVGALNTLVDAILYLCLTRWTGFFPTNQAVAKAISYSAGVLNSFIWNKTWTFHSSASLLATFLPFVLANLAGVAINAGIMYLCLNGLSLPEAVAFILATGATLVWNFTISKFIVFK